MWYHGAYEFKNFTMSDPIDMGNEVKWFSDCSNSGEGALGSVEHLARGEKIGVEAVESVEHGEIGAMGPNLSLSDL